MVIYDSIIEAVEEYGLSAQECGQLYTAIIHYLYWGREPDFKMSKVAGFCYAAMKPVFEKQRAKQEAGRRGGKAKANGLANTKQKPSKREASETTNAKQTPTKDKEKEKVEKELPNGSSKKRPRFSPPTVNEVSDYAAEIGNPTFDAESFCDYYAAQGWKLSNGNPMKDWKASVRRWNRDSQPKAGGDRYAEYNV